MELIITSVTATEKSFRKCEVFDYQTFPAELSYTFEIDVTGRGDFSKYLKKGKFNHGQLILDILNGELEIKGIKTKKL